MGIGFDFGPPPADGKVDRGWFGELLLTHEQLVELAREIDAQDDACVAEQRDDWFTVEGNHEEFMVRLGGGWLSKPGPSDEDEFERLTGLMMQIADRAGWIVTGPQGLVHGGFLECTVCGAKEFGYECPGKCPRSAIRLRCTQSAPETAKTAERTSLDRVREASTARELSESLAALGYEPSLDDPNVVLALLLDEELAPKALDAVKSLGKEAFAKRASLLDARLRRLEMLAEDPEVAKRAAALRR